MNRPRISFRLNPAPKFRILFLLTLGFLLCWAFLAGATHAETIDVSASITVTTANERSVLDRRTRMITSTADVTLTNSSSESVAAPLHAVIDILDTDYSNVTMPDAQGGYGVDPYGKYYYDLSGSLSGGVLAPGQSVTFRATFVRFYTIRFRYNVIPYGAAEAGPENQAPVADAGGPYAGVVGQAVTFDGSGSSDPDGDTLTYAWDFGDEGSGAGPNPSHTYLSEGTYTAILTVEDGKGGSDAASTQVTVIAGNQAPSLDPIGDQAVDEGESLSFQVSGSDPDDDALTYEVTGLPGGATFIATADPNVYTFSWTPDYDQSGDYTVSFKVTDPEGLYDSADVNITVNNVNRAPSFTAVSPQSVSEAVLLTFEISAVDPDGDDLTYEATSLPDGATFDPSQRIFSWEPTYDQAGDYTAEFSVTDGDLSDAITVQITVTNVNRAPTLVVEPAQSVLEGADLFFQVIGNDPDGDSLTYDASGLPAGATFEPDSATFSWTPNYEQAGLHPVVFTVTDGDLTAMTTVEITVVDVNRPPTIITAQIQDGRVDQIYRRQILAQDPDGDALTFSLLSAPAAMHIGATSGEITWRPAVSDIGEHPVDVQVSDGRGGSDSKSYVVAVPDTIPPSLFLSAPRQGVPGSTVIITATASDNAGIAAVEIDGEPEDFPALPKTVQTQKAVILPSQLGPVTFGARAWDGSGNTAGATATIEVAASFDTTPPEVKLNAPKQVAPGEEIILTASVADDESGVSSVTFFVDGEPIGTVTGPNPTIQYQVPQDASPENPPVFTIQVVDNSGNTATGEAPPPIIKDTPDTTAPQATFTAPVTVKEQESLSVTIEADDDEAGVARVDVYVNHTLVASFMEPPEGPLDIPLPPGVEPGMDALIEIVVTDHAGNTTTAEQMVSVEPSIPGVLAGEVYNDRTGLPLAGAEVRFYGEDGTILSAGTNEQGQYSLTANPGPGRIEITKDGFTLVERIEIMVPENSGLEVFDARLTPLSPMGPAVSSILGARVTAPFSAVTAGFKSILDDRGLNAASMPGGAIEVAIPPGALTQNRTFGVTQISSQGLQGLLPPGWSPVGVVDIVPRDVAFQGEVLVFLPNTLQFSQNEGLILAGWDESDRAWRAVSEVDFDESLIIGGVTSSGQYAFLAPDDPPNAPPEPVPGEILQGVALREIPEQVAAVVSPEPRIIFYRPGVHSDVGTKVTPDVDPLPSGTPFRAKITEQYEFYSGDRILLRPYVQDLVFYTLARFPLTAGYPVTPSLEFEPLTLKQGIITVDVLAPSDGVQALNIVGPEGGFISGPSGERLFIPPDAISAPIPIDLTRLTIEDLEFELPQDLTYVAGISIATAGWELENPASLSIPLPEGFVPQGQVLLVRLVELEGATRLVLVGIGDVQDEQVVSLHELSQEAKLEGILGEGRYFFVQTLPGTGYSAGTVFDTVGMPLGGALVSSSGVPVLALSDGEGKYVSCVPVGPFTVAALDRIRRDSGSASSVLPEEGGLVPLDISLHEEPPTVVSVSPEDGAENVPLASPVKIQFSEALDPSTVTPDTLSLSGPEGPVAGTLSLSSGNTLVTLRPTNALSADTLYTVTVSTGVKDLAGYGLAGGFSSTFTSLDTIPPPPPAAGAIQATIPGEDGKTTVTASQGTAGTHDTVSIVNKTQALSTPVLVNADGSFEAKVSAGITDKVMISIKDQAGNETVVPIAQFRNPDGSTVIGPEGGQLEAENGVILDIPAGTFPAGAVVKITAMTREDLGLPDWPDWPFVRGFELSCSEQPQVYLNASAPLPDGAGFDARGIIAQLTEVYGQSALSAVDTLKVIDGRLATSSPPCPGIFSKFAQYAMFLNEDEQYALGQAILFMVPPVKYTVQPYMSKQPSPIDIIHPFGNFLPLAFSDIPGHTEYYYPAHPFINLLSQGESVWDVMASAQGACLPVPADKSVVVVLRDIDTGEVAQTISLSEMQAGESMDVTDLFFVSNDLVPPVVVLSSWSPVAPYTMGSGKPIELRFSESIALQGNYPVRLKDGASGQLIFGEAVLTQGNRVVIFSPDEALKAGRSYEVLLPGVRDLAGNAYLDPPQGPLTFSVFQPYVLSLLDREKVASDLGVPESQLNRDYDFGFKDLDYATKHPAESPDNRWNTYVTAVRDDRGAGYRVFTIDVSNPRDPVVLGATGTDISMWYEFDRAELLDDFYLEPRDSLYADPQFWKSRELHYVVQDPSVKICGEPASTETRQWQEANCWPMFGYWSGIFYEEVQRQTTGYGVSVFLNFDGFNGNVKISFAPELIGRTVFVAYNNEVRSLVVPSPTRNPHGSFVSPLDWSHLNRVGTEPGWSPPEGYTGEVNPANHLDETEHVLIEDVQCEVKTGGCGDLLITTMHRIEDSYLYGYDVTNKSAPQSIIFRMLSEDRGAGVSYSTTNWWAPAGRGYPRNFTLYNPMDITHAPDIYHGGWVGDPSRVHEDTLGAFIAVENIGLELVDVGLNFPSINNQERRPSTNPGSRLEHYESLGRNANFFYNDVAVAGGKVIAVAGSGTAIRTLEVFTPSLQGPIYPPLFLQHTPVKLQTCEGYIPSDRTGDGIPDPYDIAFVLGQEGGMSVVVLYPENRSPEQVGYYVMPAGTFMWKNDNIEIDIHRKLAYVSASWTGDSPGQGILIIDLSKPFMYSVDQDGDGWDDRIIGRVKMIGTPDVPTGILHGFRHDSKRGLIYAAMRAKGTTRKEYALATIATSLPSEEIGISLTSASIDAGSGDRVFDSTDGQTSILYIDTIPQVGGQVRLNLDLDTTGVTYFQYQVSETPMSGDPADAMLDLTGSNASGTFSFSDPSIDLTILPADTMPLGSSVFIDVFDDDGNFIKRFMLFITPAQVESENIRLKTTIDRINGGMCGSPATLPFTLSHEALVTIRVDGRIVEQTINGSTKEIADLLLPAGTNQITITRDMVLNPGEHDFQITAVFRENSPQIVSTFEGTIVHDVVINEFLPVGHSFIKGVDLFDGHLSIMRQDLLIEGLGPNLEFIRTYGSVGNTSDGPMGAGWTHNYNAKIVFDSCQRVILIGGEGSGTLFFNPVPDADGDGNDIVRYQPQAGYHGRLIGYEGRAFDYFNKEGTRHRYELVPDAGAEREYRLAYIQDTFGNRLSLTYDENSPHKLLRVTDASDRTLEFSYASYGMVPQSRIVNIKGPMGMSVDYTYDSYGNLTGTTRSARSEAYAYSTEQSGDRHNLVQVTSPAGNVTRYTYYSEGDSISGYPDEYSWGNHVLIFPQKHELIRNITEGYGASEAETTQFVYDHSNRQEHILTSVTNSWRVTTRYTMNPWGSEVEKRVFMAGGDNVTRSRWAYEDGIPDVYLTQKIEPNGRVTHLAYDANGNLTREEIDLTTVPGYEPVMDGGTVMNHVVLQHTYDQTLNIPLRTVDAMGNVLDTVIDTETGAILSNSYYADDGTPVTTTYTYYGNGNLHTETDPNGNVTTYTNYDAHGNWTRKVDAAGIVWNMTFDDRSKLVESSDSMGHHKQIFYDDLDNIIRTVEYTGTASPNVEYVHTYYPDGKKHTQTDGLGHTTEFFYDALGRLVRQVETLNDAQGNPLSYEWTYVINPASRTKTETDPRGVSKVTLFDELGRIVSETVQGPYGPQQLIAAYTYDPCGNRITETSHNGAVTTYAYDGLYRLSRKILPISSPGSIYEEIKRFDAAGNLMSETDANGNRSVFSYDSLNRMISKTDAAGNEITYTYDSNGNIVEKTYVGRHLVTTSTYDALNRLLSTTQTFTDPVSGGTVEYTSTKNYDNANHSLTWTDPAGKVVREFYDGLDRVISRTADPGGLNLTTTYTYDALGNLAATTDPAGRVVENTYDGLGRKLSTRYQPQGFEESFAYDGMDLLVRETDKRGIVMEYTYDNMGRMRQMLLHEDITDPGTVRTIKEFVYEDTHANGPRMIETDAVGNAKMFTYDYLGRTVSETDALGNTTSYEYDGLHRRAMVDQLGNRTAYAFDAIGRVVLVTDAAGSTKQTVYEDELNRQTEVDERGIHTRFQYDPLGRLVQIVNSLSAPDSFDIASETNVYRGDNSLLERIDGNGNVLRLEYDPAGRKTAERRGFGTAQEARTTYSYDSADRIVSIKSPRDHGGAYDYLYSYDDAAHTATTTDGAGNVTVTTYDGDGNILSTLKPGGPVETRTYDEIGKLLSVTDPLGNTWRYTYDANRNLTVQEDANGGRVEFTYDALNNLIDTCQVLDASTRYCAQQGYDEAGNLRFTVDARGQRIDYTYDELNRVITETYSLHENPVMPYLVRIEYDRDEAGNLTTVREIRKIADTGVPAFDERTDITVKTYDNMNRLASRTNSDSKTVLYTYDANGNRASMTDPNGLTSYFYDPLNRLDRVETPLGTTEYTYYRDGLPATVAYPNWCGMDYDYDRSGFVTSILHSAMSPGSDGIMGTADDVQSQLARYMYEYDGRGNMSEQKIYGSDVSADPLTTTYVYDLADRLISVDYPGDAQMAYTYDGVGNRESEVGIDPADGTTRIDRTMQYNSINRLTQILDSIDSSNNTTFSYDPGGNMTSRTVGSQTINYRYDVRNRLTAATDFVHTGEVVFGYDYNGMRARKISPAGEIRYLYDDESLLAEYGPEPAHADIRAYTYGRELMSVTNVQYVQADPSYVQYILKDGLGSTTALTNTQGDTDSTRRYDAWGSITHSSGTADLPLGYTGHYLDSETGLIYFGARYYDSSIGRFITQDPMAGNIMNPPSLHRYLYAYANPMRYVDLDGYESVEFMPILAKHWSGVMSGLKESMDKFIKEQTAQIADIGFWAIKQGLSVPFRAVAENDPAFQYKSQAGQALAAGVPMSTVVWESLKGMAATPIDFVGSLTDLDVSPKERGALLFDTLTSIQSLGKPAVGLARKPVAFINKTIKSAEKSILTRRLLSRRRVGARFEPGHGTFDPYVCKKAIGDFAPADAKFLAGEFMKHRTVMISGGLTETALPRFYRLNMKANKSLGHLGYDIKPGKAAGDLDLHFSGVQPNSFRSRAPEINAKLTVDMIDQLHDVLPIGMTDEILGAGTVRGAAVMRIIKKHAEHLLKKGRVQSTYLRDGIPMSKGFVTSFSKGKVTRAGNYAAIFKNGEWVLRPANKAFFIHRTLPEFVIPPLQTGVVLPAVGWWGAPATGGGIELGNE